jgi:hypothetical protein
MMSGQDSNRGMWGSKADSADQNDDKPRFASSLMRREKSADSSVSKHEQTQHHLNLKRDKLGLLEKIRFDRATQVELRKQLGEIFINVLEAQKQELLYRITIGLDEAKKKIFMEMLRNSAELEKEMTRLSTDIQEHLINFGLDKGREILKNKKVKLDNVAADLEAGVISEKDYHSEVSRIESWMNTQRDNVDGEIELKIRNHIAKVEHTLEIFKKRELEGAG